MRKLGSGLGGGGVGFATGDFGETLILRGLGFKGYGFRV